MLERIRFMKVNRHKRFDYTPRYYDERKDRIENMKKLYSEEGTEKTSAQRELLRDDIRRAWRNDSSSISKQKNAANIRLIIILALILLAVYFIFGYVDIFTADVIDLEKP